MSNRRIIKQILREETSSWSRDTKSFKVKDRGQQRFAETILKRRHKEIVQYTQKKREEEPEYTSGYSEDFNEFMLELKNTFPEFGSFGHMIVTTLNDKNPLLMGMDMLHIARVVSEYILNYGDESSNERVDVVPEDDLIGYINEQFFDCSNHFFETMWDDILSGRRNYWNEDVKERMWDEIQYEVEEKSEDEEWQEENGQEFESMGREKDYFMSYWHYPMQSLGWDKMMLCDFYREYLKPGDFKDYFFTKNEGSEESNKNWGKYYVGGHDRVYFIKRNELFY